MVAVQMEAPSAIQACSRQLRTKIEATRSRHTTWRDTAYALSFRYERCYCNKEMAADHDKTISTQEYDSQRDLDLAEWEE